MRVTNGSVLPSPGLTVLTPQRLYVLGNYNATGPVLGTTNTANSAPAALMGDAITILSPIWNDNCNSPTSLNSRIASNTTVNAATLVNIVSSVTVNGVRHNSGGSDNSLPSLENWSGKILTYNDSMVVMFDSRYAIKHWQNPGHYHCVSTRNWKYDTNYSQGADKLLPIFPQFPQVKVFIRQQSSAN